MKIGILASGLILLTTAIPVIAADDMNASNDRSMRYDQNSGDLYCAPMNYHWIFLERIPWDSIPSIIPPPTASGIIPCSERGWG